MAYQTEISLVYICKGVASRKQLLEIWAPEDVEETLNNQELKELANQLKGKTFTRREIQELSEKQGYNVWLMLDWRDKVVKKRS